MSYQAFPDVFRGVRNKKTGILAERREEVWEAGQGPFPLLGQTDVKFLDPDGLK